MAEAVNSDEMRTGQVILSAATRPETSHQSAVPLEHADARRFVVHYVDFSFTVHRNSFRTKKFAHAETSHEFAGGFEKRHPSVLVIGDDILAGVGVSGDASGPLKLTDRASALAEPDPRLALERERLDALVVRVGRHHSPRRRAANVLRVGKFALGATTTTDAANQIVIDRRHFDGRRWRR